MCVSCVSFFFCFFFLYACVCVCTLISPLRCSNSELWKGQTVTFLCDSEAEMRHDVSRTERITCTHIHTIASARQIRTSLWFWPLFFDPASLGEIRAEKFFILFFRRSPQFLSPHSTPINPSQRTSSSWWNHSSCLWHRICSATDRY